MNKETPAATPNPINWVWRRDLAKALPYVMFGKKGALQQATVMLIENKMTPN
jgi:hypothetical protein